MTRKMWSSSGNSRSLLLPLLVIFPMSPLLALPIPTAAVVEVFLKFDSNPPSLEDVGFDCLTLLLQNSESRDQPTYYDSLISSCPETLAHDPAEQSEDPFDELCRVIQVRDDEFLILASIYSECSHLT